MFNGGTPDRSNDAYYEGDIPWITSADLQNGEIQDVRFYITNDAVANSATRKMPKDSLLLVTRTGVGKVAIAPFDICISQDFTGIIPDTTRINLKYLVHFLRSSQKYFTDRARGATIQGVTREVVNKLEIPLPPLLIQQRIAAVLDEVDALRQKRERSVEACRLLETATFSDIFSPYFENWEGNAKPISEIEDFITSGSRGWAQYYTEIGEPFLRIQNVGKNRMLLDDITLVSAPESAEARRTRTKTGDVLVSITADLGRSGVIDKSIAGAYINQHLSIIRQKYFLPHYLSGFIRPPAKVSLGVVG